MCPKFIFFIEMFHYDICLFKIFSVALKNLHNLSKGGKKDTKRDVKVDWVRCQQKDRVACNVSQLYLHSIFV